MKKAKCLDCSKYNNCRDSLASWVFFIVGLVATIAIRIVTILIYTNPLYAKVAWYIGVGGFFMFFIYKFRVSQARAASISRQNLTDKINLQKHLTEDDYKLINSILCGINSKKERINYFFIFGLSALALLLAVYMDFLR